MLRTWQRLDPFIGSLFLRQVHLDSLQPFIASRRADGVKTSDHQPGAGGREADRESRGFRVEGRCRA